MIKTNKVSGATLYASLLAFISFVVYILYINQEVLYTAHDRSEFIFGAPFFHTLMSKPFGLMQYVGAWLTQLFYHPALGAAVLVVIWILIFLVGTKAFQLQGKTMGQCVSGNSASSLMLLPIACLLTSVVDLGYWIYIFPIRGYWFSQSVGYLFMLLLLWAARSTTPRKWHLAWYLFGACLYPVLGWFALLFILCLLLAEKPSWQELLGIVLLFITAAICHTQLYSNLKTDDVVLAGLPRFETPMDSSEHLSLPFWMLGALSVGIMLCGKYLAKWFVPVLCAAAGIIFTTSLMYYDKNYIDEMRMVRYASNDNWKEVLNLAEDNKKPTGTMIFLKNIALMNEGGLLERSFKLGNDAANINNPDTLPKPILVKVINKAIAEGRLGEEDLKNYEEQKNNKFLFNFLSDAAKATLAQLAMDDKANISADKIFSGLVQGRISKQIKESTLLEQVYVKAEDGKQNVGAYLKSVQADLKIAKIVRFETGEGLEKKNEDFAAEVAKQMNG